MNLVNLPLIPFILINLTLASFTLLQNKRSLVNQTFSLFIFSITLWIAANLAIDNYKIVGNTDLWTSIAFSVGIYISLFFLLFSLAFVEKIKNPLNKMFLFGITIPILLISIFSFTNLVVAKTEIVNQVVTVYPGPLNTIWYLVFVIYFIFGFGTLIKEFNKGNFTRKLQLRYLLFGTIITLLLGLLINFILPLFQGNQGNLTSLTPYTLIFMEASIAYAIVKHRLLDIRLVVARTIAYSLLVVIIAIFYVSSAVLISNSLLNTTTPNAQLLVYAILTLVIAFTFQPLRKFLEKSTDKIFFKQDYDSNGLLSALTKVMAETILIDDIAHNLLKRLIADMRITRGAFVLTDGGKIFVTEGQGFKENPTYSEKDVFSLQAVDKTLIFEDLEEGPTKELLRKLDVTVVVPLKTQVDHVGLLFLGEKASGEIYSEKDLRVVEIFAPEAAISFENAKSVEKIRRFNITLKEQVDRATKELKGANEQLKELDRLKDEFLSIASHDLRTPMTAIKGYLWMALNDRAGKIENPQLKRYLDISYTSAERMIQLINDLLNVSRIKAGRVQMVFEAIEIKTIVDQVFAEIMSKASEKKIILKYIAEANFPKVALDKQRFPEILQNLIGNAIKFTPEKGKITVSVKRSKEPGLVEVAVTDTGVGLSKEDAGKLFEKYGRIETSYAKAKESGGTGLGLYITKNYVELHGGKIWVESEEGKGTSFIFTLHESNPELLKKMNGDGQQNQIAPSVPATTDSTVREMAH